MRLLSSLILLSITVIAASCSKNQYAQVEPDDLYFTHKDRKAAIGETMAPTSPVVATVEPTEVPTEYERSDYSDRHSPVFTTPSYETPTYGSPTIQQYGQKPYYDTSVNPDYLYEEEYTDLEGTSSEYYDESYAYQAPPAYETPQVNNHYYGIPTNSYYPSSAWMGSNYYPSYRPWPSQYYGYSPYSYYGPYESYWGGATYAYSPWSNYYNGWSDPYYAYYYGSSGNGYCGYPITLLGVDYYANTNYKYSDSNYDGGTMVVTKPRKSRNQSYEVDKSNLPIKSRRADYIPNSEKQSGRVATAVSNTSDQGTVSRSGYTRRGSSPTYYSDNGRTKETQANKYKSPATIQKNRTSPQKRTRTVIVPTKANTNYANRSNGQRQRNNVSNNANRSSVNRSGSTNRSNGTTRYSTRTTNANRSSSYGTRSNSSNRTRTSYGTRSSSNRSSGARSSFSSGRSSSRSFSAPSRSSGSSSRSVSTPSRSSSSRSSGTRSSSGSSSSKSSSSRKN